MAGAVEMALGAAGRVTVVEPRDEWALRFVREIPALAAATGREEGFLECLRVRTDSSLLWRGRRIHVECFGDETSSLTVVFHHGYGAYSALYSPFLGLLASEGIHVVAVDRPGHGLSEGRRGDCTVAELAEVTRLVLDEVVPQTTSIVLFGSSAGGMLTSCLIPYLDDVVSGYACHGVHNPAHARRLTGHLLGAFAAAVPWARYPYRLIPPRIRRGISTNPAVRDWFRPGSDRLATLNPTLRSVFSMTVAYSPPGPPRDVNRPVLVLAGQDDRMLPVNQTMASVHRMGLRNVDIEVVAGGHMLLHEAPQDVLGAFCRWLRTLDA